MGCAAEFWQRHFEADDGRFKAAFNRFVALDDFEAQLEQHLRELLRRRLPPQRVRVTPHPVDHIEWWSGSPYRGLQAFDVAHAAVFFGRERAEREITEALVRRSAEDFGFMLVVGASGSGKSSLVRAGLLPDLMAPGVVQGVTVWRHAIVHPAELAPDPFAGLAAALLRAEALPELAVIGYREAELADQLRAADLRSRSPCALHSIMLQPVPGRQRDRVKGAWYSCLIRWRCYSRPAPFPMRLALRSMRCSLGLREAV